MSRATPMNLVEPWVPVVEDRPKAPELRQCLSLLGVGPDQAQDLPFGPEDVTAGSECELQTAVIGTRETVELPLSIEHSSVFANLCRRAAAGDAPWQAAARLGDYLHRNEEGVWENSWVRFPRHLLSAEADAVLSQDLLADRGDPASGRRTDAGRFVRREGGEEMVRVPVSYLLKLALADALAGMPSGAGPIRSTGERLLVHFSSDNTSPETFSFHVSHLSRRTGSGREVARETAKRFLLTQLLVSYANERFHLASSGQRVVVFFSPHPPIRQKRLNNCIPDAFYRELFMNPCLSGWDRGEAKHHYMRLCHQVLSRSHLNAVGKLREAGIICRNLVVLPNTSNLSLANNGIHVSLGSRRLTEFRERALAGYTRAHEKCVGDHVIKLVEHFLPLFVGTYSADPYRIDFAEFHPESVLGFLPHELDYTHLRMLWWRWRRKARNRVLGHALTPYGPEALDQLLSTVLRLRGDWVPDFRLIDYLVALRSTADNPALDGSLGSSERLKKDLEDLGEFDARMSLYLPIKLREFDAMGFSGFEARHYSLFPDLARDMTAAVDLQVLVTALAFKYLASGLISSIPDDPFTESERRQAFFVAAAGIDRVYIHRNSASPLLRRVLTRVGRTSRSRRYPDYLKVSLADYQLGLLELIRKDGADLIEMLGLGDMVEDLRQRLAAPEEYAASGKLTRRILESAGARSVWSLSAREFNSAAERFYRQTLRAEHIRQGFAFLREDLGWSRYRVDFESRPELGRAVLLATGGVSPTQFLAASEPEIVAGSAGLETIQGLIQVLLLCEHLDAFAAKLSCLGEA